jgi:hypothetical protein
VKIAKTALVRMILLRVMSVAAATRSDVLGIGPATEAAEEPTCRREQVAYVIGVRLPATW